MSTHSHTCVSELQVDLLILGAGAQSHPEEGFGAEVMLPQPAPGHPPISAAELHAGLVLMGSLQVKYGHH